jgi:hypothetical protein
MARAMINAIAHRNTATEAHRNRRSHRPATGLTARSTWPAGMPSRTGCTRGAPGNRCSSSPTFELPQWPDHSPLRSASKRREGTAMDENRRCAPRRRQRSGPALPALSLQFLASRRVLLHLLGREFAVCHPPAVDFALDFREFLLTPFPRALGGRGACRRIVGVGHVGNSTAGDPWLIRSA